MRSGFRPQWIASAAVACESTGMRVGAGAGQRLLLLLLPDGSVQADELQPLHRRTGP
jgi:hypothetical protein